MVKVDYIDININAGVNYKIILTRETLIKSYFNKLTVQEILRVKNVSRHNRPMYR